MGNYIMEQQTNINNTLQLQKSELLQTIDIQATQNTKDTIWMLLDTCLNLS